MLDKLVDNAVDFTKDGDTIGVSVSSASGKVMIDVRNPGPPLPEEMRGELFDSMVSVRNDKSDEHLGLGLYIARAITEGHGGQLLASNLDDGSGVEFCLRFALAE